MPPAVVIRAASPKGSGTARYRTGPKTWWLSCGASRCSGHEPRSSSPDRGRHPPVRARSFAPARRENDDGRRAATSKLTWRFRGADIVPMALSLLKGPFTVDAYQRLGELGILHQDDRVELVAGQVVELTPIGDRHASCVRRLINLFAPNLRDLAVLDAQNPVVLGSHDAPQPDLALLHRRAGGYGTHPRSPSPWSSPPVPRSTNVERGNDGRTTFPLSRRERGSKG